MLKRNSAIAEKLRDAQCQLKPCQLLHRCTKKNHINFAKACSKRMTSKDIQNQVNCRYMICHISLAISGIE